MEIRPDPSVEATAIGKALALRHQKDSALGTHVLQRENGRRRGEAPPHEATDRAVFTAPEWKVFAILMAYQYIGGIEFEARGVDA